MADATFFTWTEDLSVHVGGMDDEHRRLIGLMNRLHERHVAGNAGREELASLLDEFQAVVLEHFRHEEEYMAEIEYPELASHTLVHRRLLENLQERRNEFDAGDGTLPESLFRFLKFWLNAHIKGVDMKYAAHVPVQ